MGIIFDLDQTLVDSRIAKPLRDRRDWNGVYNLIPSFSLYPTVLDLLQYVHANQIPLAIVTSSPRPYCQKVIDYFALPIDTCVCYHDTSKHKPHPEPIILAVEKMRVINRGSILSFGDDAQDIMASNGANVISVACMWGTSDAKSLLSSNPNHICNTPEDMSTLIREYFAL